MRYKRLILTLASSLLLITCRLEAQVTQEIIYHCKDAGEVYLVWGINNWGLPSEKAVPGNSQVKEALVYSKMIKHGDSFHLNLNLPANTILDYVFLISKDKMSAPVEIWDTNSGEGKKDYHTVIGKDSKAEIFSSVKIESSGRALVKPRDGLLASGMKLCLFSAALLLLCSIFLRKITAREDRLDPYLSIVLQFFVLSFFLLFIRAAVMGHNWSSGSEFIDILPGLSAGFFSDLLLVAICMGLMLCVALLLRRSAVLNHLPAFNLFICAVVLICCAVNIKTVQLLGRPLNYQWLYYSDFLGSSDAKNAIVSNISEELVYNLSAVLISFLILCFIPKNLLPALGSRGKRIMLGGLLLCTGAALAYTYTAAGNAAMPASRTENPLISFITSLEPFAGQPSLFSMGTKEKFAPPSCSCTQSCPIDNRDIRNVIVYVLESTPAEYLQPYSERYKATPVLKSLMSQSWVFNNIYAHAPATNKSLVPLLCSLYPWLSFNSISQ
jgi:lipoteichoic acid synthase